MQPEGIDRPHMHGRAAITRGPALMPASRIDSRIYRLSSARPVGTL